MISMHPPGFSTPEVFDICIDGAQEGDRKHRIRSVRQAVLDHAEEYLSRTHPNRLDQIDVDFCPDELTSGSDLTWVYTNRLVASTRGREVYDKILASATGSICPLCGVKPADTIDHYLPKEHYPIFSVTPQNLVPACRVCNTHKAAKYPRSPNELFIHPYFDEIDDHKWLHAVVIEGGSKGLDFSINEVEAWDETMRLRVAHHMGNLKLVEAYSFEASFIRSDINYRLNILHQDIGAVGVRNYLLEEEVSRRNHHLNSCRAVAYSAWANSLWFCDGGFNFI